MEYFVPIKINNGVPQGSVIAYRLSSRTVDDLHFPVFDRIQPNVDDSTLCASTLFFILLPPILTLFFHTEYIFSLNLDLCSILEWRSSNLVKFNSLKIQFST